MTSPDRQPHLTEYKTPYYVLRARLVYSTSPKVGNPIASVLKSTVPALFVPNPVSNFLAFTV